MGKPVCKTTVQVCKLELQVHYSTLVHVPPLGFHCVGGCLDLTDPGLLLHFYCSQIYDMACSQAETYLLEEGSI
jgi:hypothetical protein